MMGMRRHLKAAILSIDAKLASSGLPWSHEQGALLCFVIHGLFATSGETQSELLDAQQGFTVEMLRALIGHFTCEGYRFVSPEDLTKRLWHRGRYVLLTFDDGYYNNIRALPVLEEFGVPAVFFISTDHVKQGKAFWWDVVYREFRKRGRREKEIKRAVSAYKAYKTSEIESDLSEQFGLAALTPASNLDRPFTPSELNKFANHPLVFLGNHTKNHAILTNYSAVEVKEQILGGQEEIREMTGKFPKIIAYPDGRDSAEIRAVAREAGMQFGLLVRPGRNHLPLNSATDDALKMKRFTLWGDLDIEMQARMSRSGLSLYRLLNGIRNKATAAERKPRPAGKTNILANLAGS